MNPTSLIVARYLKVHGKPELVWDGNDPNPHEAGAQGSWVLRLTTDDVSTFCYDQFAIVPSESVALKVRAALLVIARSR